MNEQLKLKPPKDELWTKKRENKCKVIANRRAAFVWLHNKAAKKYNFDKRVWAFIIIIAGYIVGPSGVLTSFTEASKLKYFGLTIGILVIVLAILGTIQEKLGYTSKVKKQTYASSYNSSLFLEIKRELRKTRKNRQSYRKFYSSISDREYEINQNVPDIPKKTMREYYTKFGQEALPYRELFNGFEIDVAEEDGPVTTRESDKDLEIKSTKLKKPKIKVVEKGRHEEDLRKRGVTIKKLKGRKISNSRRYELRKYFIN